MIDINICTNEVINNFNPILGNNLELILQQIDMLFGTDKYDVLGDINYGTNYDKYLYTTGVSNVALENKILYDINSLELFGFTPSVKVTLLEGSIRDIALIDITISGEYESLNKIYRIE